jgi:hypothetical protein
VKNIEKWNKIKYTSSRKKRKITLGNEALNNIVKNKIAKAVAPGGGKVLKKSFFKNFSKFFFLKKEKNK